MQPLVPAKYAVILGLIGTALTGAASFVPPPFSVPVLIVGALALFLSGHGLPQLKILDGKPIVPLAAVPILGTLGATLAQFALSQPANSALQASLLLGAGVLSWLSGKALPSPQAMIAEKVGADAAAATDTKAAQLTVLDGEKK